MESTRMMMGKWGRKLMNLHINYETVEPYPFTRVDLEWILDQYKEKKPKDKTIAEKFNTYRFADYKEKVIDLLQRVCTVSVETMKIIQEMENISD